MSKTIIEVKNLKKNYGDFIAVDHISFNIAKGEIFGFLGPNGAGKTTTINMLIGMAKVSDGKIFYNGTDLTNNIKKAQEIIGVVADESNLYSEMSGYENLCFCGSLYGLARTVREQRAKELLQRFGLSEVADKKYKAYSKGMKRKLTIAAALIHEPQILFLDEPTTGIDVISARYIREMIKKLNKERVTVFLTTHYIEEAERLCHRVAFIDKGRIINIGTVDELLYKTKEINSIEVVFESLPMDKNEFLKQLDRQFTSITGVFKDDNAIKIMSKKKLDISPIVQFMSSKHFFILEAKLIKPTLEDAFVKMTGIEIHVMQKEKEKK